MCEQFLQAKSWLPSSLLSHHWHRAWSVVSGKHLSYRRSQHAWQRLAYLSEIQNSNKSWRNLENQSLIPMVLVGFLLRVWERDYMKSTVSNIWGKKPCIILTEWLAYVETLASYMYMLMLVCCHSECYVLSEPELPRPVYPLYITVQFKGNELL